MSWVDEKRAELEARWGNLRMKKAWRRGGCMKSWRKKVVYENEKIGYERVIWSSFPKQKTRRNLKSPRRRKSKVKKASSGWRTTTLLWQAKANQSWKWGTEAKVLWVLQFLRSSKDVQRLFLSTFLNFCQVCEEAEVSWKIKVRNRRADCCPSFISMNGESIQFKSSTCFSSWSQPHFQDHCLRHIGFCLRPRGGKVRVWVSKDQSAKFWRVQRFVTTNCLPF